MSLPTTRWTIIDAARGGDEDAFGLLVTRYRAPVIGYMRRRGLASEAEDLSQEVFLRFFDKQILAGAEPAKGRFRNLLLAVARNVANAHVRQALTLKRGAGDAAHSLGEIDPPSPEKELETFDREWLANLLDLALRCLRSEYPRYYGAISRFLLQKQTYEEIAAAMGCGKGDVKNLIHRGKRKLAQFLREDVRGYTSSRGEFNTELELLSRMLPK